MTHNELLQIARRHYDKSDVAQLGRAIALAQEKHALQQRASGEAYIVHPLSVAAILIEWRMDIDSVIAGVLHDTIEDTNLSLEQIQLHFGQDVAFLVDGVTQVSKARSGMKELSSYLPQTSDNLSKLLIATSQDLRVLIIKLADRLHNLRTLEHLTKDKQRKIAQESLQVFAPLANRLGMGQVKGEIEDLSFRYLSPKEFFYLQQLIKKRIGRTTKDFRKIEQTVAEYLTEQGLSFSIGGRIKGTYSLYRKLKKRPIEEIFDILALRIVVDNKETCYRVLGILHSLYQPLLSKIKDYIAVPKPNGYQSIHTTVISPSKHIIEFQIRTQDMHDFAEHGLAASFHYNEQKSGKNYVRRDKVTELPRSLHWIIELQELTHRLQAGEVPDGEGLHLDFFSDRIFVYSPKGDIYDLPDGATALDFAYAIHSDIGDHAYSAEVNGRIARLSAPLSNGDIVKIIARSSIKPKKDWLEFVTTSKAKNKIRSRLASL